jgi:hypothetical protein
MAMLQDPKIQQVMGQNPQAQMLVGALHAHIAEHAGFAYRKKIEEQLGVPLPLPGKDQDPEIERELAPLIAQAAQQLLKQNQIDMAQQQQAQAAQQAQQDPQTQIDMQKLQLEGRKVAVSEKKLEVDAAAKEDQLQIERERIASQERIAGVQVGSKVAHDKATLAAKQQAEGLRIGTDVARNIAQMKNQANQSAQQAQQPKKESD